MKKLFRKLLSTSIAESSLLGIAQCLAAFERSTNRLTTVTYHRVGTAGDLSHCFPGMISASTDRFRKQMQLLADHFNVVHLDTVVSAIQGDCELPSRSVLITFDDAYVDFASNAWPIMREFGFSPVLFVPTGFPDTEQRFWWDDVHWAVEHSGGQLLFEGQPLPTGTPAQRQTTKRTILDQLKKLPHTKLKQIVEQLLETTQPPSCSNGVLSWSELQQLQRDGVVLAPHTRHHKMLDQVERADAQRDIVDSFMDLGARDINAPRVLAYPSGQYSPQVLEVMQAEGFLVGFTTNSGTVTLPTISPLELSRLNVGQATTANLLHARLLLGR